MKNSTKIPYKDRQLKDLEGREFLKEKARIRDNYTCQKCGSRWVPRTRRFDVHHKNMIPSQTEAIKYRNNKDMDKLITLCHKCHMNEPLHKLAIAKKPFMWEYTISRRIRFRERELALRLSIKN